jgi:hypothetical protein
VGETGEGDGMREKMIKKKKGQASSYLLTLESQLHMLPWGDGGWLQRSVSGRFFVARRRLEINATFCQDLHRKNIYLAICLRFIVSS